MGQESNLGRGFTRIGSALKLTNKMNALDYSHLISALWRYGYFSGVSMTSYEGRSVVVRSAGEPTDDPLTWCNATIEVDGCMYSGEVLLGSASEVSESAIIRIVECDAPQLLKLNGVFSVQHKELSMWQDCGRYGFSAPSRLVHKTCDFAPRAQVRRGR